MRRVKLYFAFLLLLLSMGGAYGGCGGSEISQRCVSYCENIVSCGFDIQSSCENSCQSKLNRDEIPYGESCVLYESCDAASLCILCDQYSERMNECGLSTSGSSSACRTNLEGGADEGAYQCVINASSCEEVPNCGI